MYLEEKQAWPFSPGPRRLSGGWPWRVRDASSAVVLPLRPDVSCVCVRERERESVCVCVCVCVRVEEKVGDSHEDDAAGFAIPLSLFLNKNVLPKKKYSSSFIALL